VGGRGRGGSLSSSEDYPELSPGIRHERGGRGWNGGGGDIEKELGTRRREN
jgi:hypothetical protein